MVGQVDEHDAPGLVVAVGASAGGLDALEELLRAIPPYAGMAVIVAQHLHPDHKSDIVELLAKHTAMRVVAVEDGARLARDTAYVLPPRKVVTVRAGQLRVEERSARSALPIDVLFRSLAEELGERAAAVVLSGTGSDGARGARAVSDAGGIVAIQDPTTARFDGMPRAVMSIGIADHVLPVREIPGQLLRDAEQRARVGPPLDDRGHAAILELLRRQTGVDFGLYKPSMVTRRIQRRMAAHVIERIEDYVALARSSPREVDVLFEELLIGVTRFFRDPDAFEALRAAAIPALAEAAMSGEPIRVWVTGCATGEEAYSIAMLFEEHLEDRLRDRGRPYDVKIFATDIDRDALDRAAAGVYPESIAADVSPERLARFFVRRGDSYQVVRSLRQRVVLANHDVTRDPPFTRVALVSCRNLLIYLDAQTQQQVLGRFRFALRPGGYLFLGTSERPGEPTDALEAVDPGARLYRRTTAWARMPALGPRGGGPRGAAMPPPLTPDLAARDAMHALLGAYAPPSVLVTAQHDVLHIFGQPSPLLKLAPGAASLNLLQLLPPPVASVVSLATHRALRDDTVAEYRDVPAGDAGTVAVTARPLPSRGVGRLALVSLALEDPGPQSRGSGALPPDVQRQILELEQELQHSREDLRASIEELEISNEELQAANEELLASNEELQSTNEELQSLNEELHTLNTEHQRKIRELLQVNDDIDNLLISTRLGSVFLDEDLAITRFTPAIAPVMRLTAHDVGRPLAGVPLRFDAAELFAAIDEVRATRQPVERALALPGDESFVLRIAPYVSESAASRGGVVITALDVTAIRQTERRMARVLDALPHQVAVLDDRGVIRIVNRAWREHGESNGGRAEASGPGVDYVAVCRRAGPDAPEAGRAAALLAELLAGRARVGRLEYPCHGPHARRWFQLHAAVIDGDERWIVVSHVDVTARMLLELAAEGGSASREGAR